MVSCCQVISLITDQPSLLLNIYHTLDIFFFFFSFLQNFTIQIFLGSFQISHFITDQCPPILFHFTRYQSGSLHGQPCFTSNILASFLFLSLCYCTRGCHNKITEAFPPIDYQKLTTLNKDKKYAYGRPLHLSRCADSSNKTKTNVLSSFFCVFFVVLVIVVGVVFFVNISLPPYRVSWKSLETKLKIKLNGLFTSYLKKVSFSQVITA